MMKRSAPMVFLLVCSVLLHLPSWAQEQQLQDTGSSSLYDKVTRYPDKLLQNIDEKTSDVSGRLARQTDKYLSKMARQEEKLRKKLAGKDSLAAVRIFGDAQQQYAALQSRVQKASSTASRVTGTYLPHLDSLQTAFQFLGKADGLLKNIPEGQQRLKDAMGKMNVLQNKFSQAEQASRFVQERQRYLKEQLASYNLSRYLKKYQKQAYYYREQLESYRRLYSDPGKLEAKVLDMLSRTAQFREFFARNSQLAGLFRLPAGSGGGGAQGSQDVIPGLQTREGVQQQLEQHFGSGVDAQRVVSQSVQGAQKQLGEIRDKLESKAAAAGISSGGAEGGMPDFRPNGQKVKSVWQRLEWGSNLQTVKANRFFPSTTDVGVSLGYKLNDRSVVGVGGSYRMGWGKNIRHISITHQGVGLRTYVDYRLKGNLWLSGGGEMNYRSEIRDIDVLKDYSSWQKSALMGVSKRYRVSSKVKGNMQLLYDALWKQQVPRTQPLLFRVGYNWK